MNLALATTPRDYVTEMRALLDAESDCTDPAPLVAARVVNRLRNTDPDLLAGWLDQQATTIVRAAINEAGRSTRTRNRVTASRSVFAAAVQTGDVTQFTDWLNSRYVVSEGRRPTLAEMTAADLRYAADRYDDHASAAKFEAAFLRALAKQVRSGTVGDHFTEDQITQLRSTLA